LSRSTHSTATLHKGHRSFLTNQFLRHLGW
jgi:hypothetical protein